MSTGKKIGVWILILFALAALFVSSCTLVMFLAPGTEIFGVKYVSALVGNYEKDVTLEAFDGDIYIETANVPITLEFTDYYSTSLSFHQKFTGFTTTKIEQAGMDYYVENGNLKIKTTEFIKFIYAKEDYDYFHFDLKLPATFFQSGTRSVYIVAEDSSVKFVGDNISLKNLSVKTGNGFKIDGQLETTELLTLNLGRSIEINDKFICDDVDLTTSGSSAINIKNDISGNIKANTTSGNVSFKDCNSICVNTKSGVVTANGNVNYSAQITSRSGPVKLKEINALGLLEGSNSFVKTTSGKISVDKAKTLDVQSESGGIYVGEADTLNVKNKIGYTNIRKVNTDLNVDVKNGKVVLGENGTINNVKLKNKTGLTYVYNTTGTVDLYSENNDIVYKNLSSENITIKSGRKLTAENLIGVVNIVANGNTVAKFLNVTENVYIEVKNRAKTLDIYATSVSAEHISYVLRSTKGERGFVYAGGVCLNRDGQSSISNVNSGQNVINAKSVYARIRLYLGK